jgi:hypothetical protein
MSCPGFIFEAKSMRIDNGKVSLPNLLSAGHNIRLSRPQQVCQQSGIESQGRQRQPMGAIFSH